MTMVLSLMVLLLVVGGMAIGVIMGGKPIKGSCGGLNAVGITGDCEICGGNPNKCEENAESKGDASLAVNASKVSPSKEE